MARQTSINVCSCSSYDCLSKRLNTEHDGESGLSPHSCEPLLHCFLSCFLNPRGLLLAPALGWSPTGDWFQLCSLGLPYSAQHSQARATRASWCQVGTRGGLDPAACKWPFSWIYRKELLLLLTLVSLLTVSGSLTSPKSSPLTPP